jgi:hypothetical protein
MELQKEPQMHNYLFIDKIEHRYSPDDFIFTLKEPIDIKYRQIKESCNGCETKLNLGKLCFW